MKNNHSKKNRLSQNAILMETVKRRLTDSATSTVPEVLSRLGARLTGLSENEIRDQRNRYGNNTITKGAVSMSKKKIIVKNLNSIQNFGAIDILCTDKTGTLTLLNQFVIF